MPRDVEVEAVVVVEEGDGFKVDSLAGEEEGGVGGGEVVAEGALRREAGLVDAGAVGVGCREEVGVYLQAEF